MREHLLRVGARLDNDSSTRSDDHRRSRDGADFLNQVVREHTPASRVHLESCDEARLTIPGDRHDAAASDPRDLPRLPIC